MVNTPPPQLNQPQQQGTQPVNFKYFPSIPAFRYDPSLPDGTASWFDQLAVLFNLHPSVTDIERCALVFSALDVPTFNKVRLALDAPMAAFADWNKLQETMIKLFDVKQSLFASRYACFQIEWKGPTHESIHEFAARIRRTIQSFEFDKFKENELKTLTMLMAMKERSLEPIRTKLLNMLMSKHDVPFEDCEKAVADFLQTQRDQRLPEAAAAVNYVKRTNDQKPQRPVNKPKSPCPACGGDHWKKDCKFKDAVCHSCNKPGHLKSMCKPSKSHDNDPVKSNHKVGCFAIPSSYKISGVSTSSCNRRMINLTINGIPLKAQLDSGSDITILCREDYQSLGAPQLTGASLLVNGAGKNTFQIDGSFDALVELAGESDVIVIHVADTHRSLIGLNAFDAFDLDNKNISQLACYNVSTDSIAPPGVLEGIKGEFADLFSNSVDAYTQSKIHLQVKAGSQPIHIKARRMSPQALCARQVELERLQKLDVIFPVDHFRYASPCPIVKSKDGRGRLVIDFSTALNDQLEEASYTLPTADEIFADLHGDTVYSAIDLSDCISEFLIAYRAMPNNATPGNCTPAFAHLGREIRTSFDLLRPQVILGPERDDQMEARFNHQFDAIHKNFKDDEPVHFRMKTTDPWLEGVDAARIGSRLFRTKPMNSEKLVRRHANQMMLRNAVSAPVIQHHTRFKAARSGESTFRELLMINDDLHGILIPVNDRINAPNPPLSPPPAPNPAHGIATPMIVHVPAQPDRVTSPDSSEFEDALDDLVPARVRDDPTPVQPRVRRQTQRLNIASTKRKTYN